MKPVGRLILVLGVLVGLAGCGSSDQSQGTGQEAKRTFAPRAEGGDSKKVSGMAVAGLFYPRHEKDLSKAVDGYLDDAQVEPIKNLRAIVCPHAGYEFSGKTAGIAYKQLKDRQIRTVVVMAPSHHAAFKGAMVPDAEAYETPLGLIPVSSMANELAATRPFVVSPECKVDRPDFWKRSPKRELPPFGEDTPDTWEHSLEVQLPFLQRTLSDFSIVPIIFGEVDPAAVAEGLLKFLDDETLLVASSDLSHYNPYQLAKAFDTRTVKAICDLDSEDIGHYQACGYGPVRTVITVARKKGWKAKLLDYRNSGDTSGEKRRVVGYAAVAFYEPEAGESTEAEPEPSKSKQEFSPKDRKFLLRLARDTVTGIVSERTSPAVEEAALAKKFVEERACFITLTKKGQLRGCIGAIFPEEPLYLAVMHKARAAAVADPRFERVKPEELADIEVEVSVLSLPRQLDFRSPDDLMAKLRPKIDGVVLSVGRYQATYLPQVWDQITEKEDFLDSLAVKAGMTSAGWRRPEAVVLVYQVEAFKESEGVGSRE